METIPKEYWFKRKRFGWGWTPVTWQGWVVVAVPIAAILVASFLLPSDPKDSSVWQVVGFFGLVLGSVGALLYLGRKHGPSPKWRWGRELDDDPDKDF